MALSKRLVIGRLRDFLTIFYAASSDASKIDLEIIKRSSFDLGQLDNYLREIDDIVMSTGVFAKLSTSIDILSSEGLPEKTSPNDKRLGNALLEIQSRIQMGSGANNLVTAGLIDVIRRHQEILKREGLWGE